MTSPRVYVGTYAKYNDGSIDGKWLDLEDYSDRAEFIEACNELHKDEEDPEIMFQDYEGFPSVFYNESEIDENAWEWLTLDEDQRDISEAMVDYGFDWGTFDIDECCVIASGVCEQNKHETIGDYYLFESGCYEIPEFLVGYIDTEKFGRDCDIDGTYLLTESGTLFEYNN